MSIFNVSPKKENELLERMKKFNVTEDDIEEKFIKASGPGGQKVNKTSSGVSLNHIPTGIKVKYQQERSQSLNRFFARRVLVDHIEREQNGFTAEEKKRREKIRSKKRKRTKSGKAKHEESCTKQEDSSE